METPHEHDEPAGVADGVLDTVVGGVEVAADDPLEGPAGGRLQPHLLGVLLELLEEAGAEGDRIGV